MKEYSLCLLLFVITVGSAYGLHPLNTQFSHDSRLHKRNAELNQLRMCQGILAEEQCNNGLIQEGINLILQCNIRSAADLLADGCRQNSNGLYCAVAFTYFEDVTTAETECATSTEVCTPRCRNLLMLLKINLGCCANLILNNTLSLLNTPAVFNPVLWSSCNVEPITEECRSSPVEVPDIRRDFSCTNDIFVQQSGSLQCSQRFLQPIINQLNDNGCESYSQAALEQCGIDEKGNPCYLRSSSLATTYTNAIDACATTDTNTCEVDCTQTLEDLANTGGCCVNNFFNGSLAGITQTRYNFFSSEYWAQCGLNSPGFCETRLNGTPATVRASVSVAAILFLVASLL